MKELRNILYTTFTGRDIATDFIDVALFDRWNECVIRKFALDESSVSDEEAFPHLCITQGPDTISGAMKGMPSVGQARLGKAILQFVVKFDADSMESLYFAFDDAEKLLVAGLMYLTEKTAELEAAGFGNIIPSVFPDNLCSFISSVAGVVCAVAQITLECEYRWSQDVVLKSFPVQ